MCPAALHDKQRMVLSARLRIVPDCGFPVLSAFHESPELLSAEHYPQAGFPAAPYEDDPAQTLFLRGISLLVEHKCDGLAPAVWVSVCFAAGAAQDEYAEHWYGDAPCVGTEQLHGRFRGRSFLPARSLSFLRCSSGQTASCSHSVPLQISAPSGAAQWMQLDVLAVCLSGGRFVLECLEWKSPPICVSWRNVFS